MNFRFWRLLYLLLFIPFWNVAAVGRNQVSPEQGSLWPWQISEEPAASRSEEIAFQYVVPEMPEPTRAEEVVRALAAAYPDRIGQPEFFDGDWTIEVYGERFYYAEGRLLPASHRHRVNEYNPLTFYSYQKDLAPWEPPTPEESARMREMMASRNSQNSSTQRGRAPFFFDALWRSRSRDEAWDRVKQIRFLGHPVMVHYSIMTQLSLVEEHIQKAAKTSAAVRTWIANLGTAEGWTWRDVASSSNRSYHSYGVAIDLLPGNLGGLQTYWLWTSQHTPEWWTVPYTRRYHPPQEVIEAFEAFGFVWGGKWRYFDTMHFEYRPEVFILNNIPMMDLHDLR